MENQKMARMRLLDEAFEEIKALDPETKISKNFIRQLAITGKIPVIMVGNRRLINLDGLITYLNNMFVDNESDLEETGKIRKQV